MRSPTEESDDEGWPEDPTDAYAYRGLAGVRKEQGDFDGAIREMREYVRKGDRARRLSHPSSSSSRAPARTPPASPLFERELPGAGFPSVLPSSH